MPSIFDTLDENYIKFENYIIHIIIDNEKNLWFNANNSAEALGYIDKKDALKKHVDKKDKVQLSKINNKNIKGHPQTLYLNEGGLYSIILSSKLPKAKKFKEWVTHEVLPSIRKYGSYKLKKKYESSLDNITKKMNNIKKENQRMQRELKKDKFPEGGLVYAIDYSDDNDKIYRIGMTGDMKARKRIHDTHSLYKREIKVLHESDCPIRLESCVRAMLYEYRYKDKKDFYFCNLKTVKKAFKTCSESIECMKQKGGSDIIESYISKHTLKIDFLNKTIHKLSVKLNK
jgi:prophage antirepressor-like protein